MVHLGSARDTVTVDNGCNKLQNKKDVDIFTFISLFLSLKTYHTDCRSNCKQKYDIKIQKSIEDVVIPRLSTIEFWPPAIREYVVLDDIPGDNGILTIDHLVHEYKQDLRRKKIRALSFFLPICLAYR